MSSKTAKKGFTLIEVILFLAVSSLILIGILSGTGTSLAQQRYNDSVEDIYSFLQSQYSGAIDVRNTRGQGNSDRAIYGKLISIEGETINAWTIVGDAIGKGAVVTDVNSTFNSLNLTLECNENSSYSVQWGSRLQTTSRADIKREVAILRSPTNGTVYTYRSKNDSSISDCSGIGGNFIGGSTFTDVFEQADLDICVESADKVYGDKRRNIRIANANGIDSVRLIPLNTPAGGDNKCL